MNSVFIEVVLADFLESAKILVKSLSLSSCFRSDCPVNPVTPAMAAVKFMTQISYFRSDKQQIGFF
jgi:hypothetical protein